MSVAIFPAKTGYVRALAAEQQQQQQARKRICIYIYIEWVFVLVCWWVRVRMVG